METIIYSDKSVFTGDELKSCFFYQRGDLNDQQEWVITPSAVWTYKGEQYLDYGEATYRVRRIDPHTDKVELVKVVDPREQLEL